MANIWLKRCFCKKNAIEFQSTRKIDEKSVDILFCPECSEYASEGSLLIKLLEEEFPPSPGIWGIKFNKEVLKEQDQDFKDTKEYYERLFLGGKCTFNLIFKKNKKKPIFEILGIKEKLGKEELLSGQTKKMIEKGGMPQKLPKKLRGEPIENYIKKRKKL